jgi:cytochrome c-type biogenesis protein CcmE
VTVKRDGGTFVGEKDSLVTKCPSKFQEQSKTQKT